MQSTSGAAPPVIRLLLDHVIVHEVAHPVANLGHSGLTIDEALRIGRQIGEALEGAHIRESSIGI